MQDIIKNLLEFHIAAGIVALISAPIAIYFRKNAKKHRPLGRIYFYAMLAVFISAIVLSIAGRNVFLFLIAFFSFNFAWNGWRSIKAMKNKGSKKLDIYVNYFSLLFNAFLIGAGIYFLATGKGTGLGILSIIFGGIGFIIGLRFNRIFKKEMKARDWLGQHITSMGGAYIATVTAFSATNITFLPDFWRWILPTIIGSLILTLYMIRFRKTQKT